VPVKDHENLLNAAAILRQQGVGFTTLIAGEGPLRASLESQIAARQLTAHVRLLGQRTDIERLFAALDVFVLPSKSEGMSNTILEAMASGTPVVASRVGGADELVDHGRTGLLVPPENSDALAAALMRLLQAPALRRQMGCAGRNKAETEFSLPRMLRDYETFYLEVARATCAD
jgi:glycosyltransferase involved in cell wall biosynthesis